MSKKIILLIFTAWMFTWESSARAQASFSTENHFRELFMTAGYSTAFGAALGAAAIGLTENPADKLRYVAVGASLGFITGSLVGSWLIFTPLVSWQNQYHSSENSLSVSARSETLTLTPVIMPEMTGQRYRGGLALDWKW
ncbi:MAG: hypothetical protein H6618_05505 [Deltaproteobacteria bacterium]|nr:hypothetical protein [Deltaproteobacteria bacterium]